MTDRLSSANMPAPLTNSACTKGSVIDRLRMATAFAIDLIYPRRCAGCARRGAWLCDDCDQAINRFAPPWCVLCGVPERLPCRCSSMPEGINAIRSAGPFDGWLREAVIHCKYHGEWGRIEHLGTLLAAVADDLQPIGAFVPVPLHPSRLRQRGFNQSLLLARYAGRQLNVPVDPVLMRSRRTESQVRLGATQRFMNVQGAFELQSHAVASNRRFVLVDDVITTGSTLGACAAALIRGGAATVDALTVAREV